MKTRAKPKNKRVEKRNPKPLRRRRVFSFSPLPSSTAPSPSSHQRSSVPLHSYSDAAADRAEAAAADSAVALREGSNSGVRREDLLALLLLQRTEAVEDLRSSEDILPEEVDSSVVPVPAADTVQEDQEEVERDAAADSGGWGGSEGTAAAAAEEGRGRVVDLGEEEVDRLGKEEEVQVASEEVDILLVDDGRPDRFEE